MIHKISTLGTNSLTLHLRLKPAGSAIVLVHFWANPHRPQRIVLLKQMADVIMLHTKWYLLSLNKEICVAHTASAENGKTCFRQLIYYPQL